MRMGLGVVTTLSSFFPIPQPSPTEPKNTSEKPATNRQPPGLRTEPDAQQAIKNANGMRFNLRPSQARIPWFRAAK